MPRTISSRTPVFHSPSDVSRDKGRHHRGRRLLAVASRYPVSCRLVAAILLVALSPYFAGAQTGPGTENRTPEWLTPGSPPGSYSVSAREDIDLFGGGLNFSIPLYTHGGRGSLAIPDLVTIDRRQWYIKVEWVFPDGTANYNPLAPISTGGPFTVVGRRGGYGHMISDEFCGKAYGVYGSTLTRLTFTTPDGTEVELRDAAKSGEPQYVNDCNEWGQSRGKLFVSADGSAATFYADADVVDYRWIQNVEHPVTPNDYKRLFHPSGYLMLRDGTRFRVVDGQMVWGQDRNGNRTLFGNGITDPLGRNYAGVATPTGWEKSFPRVGGGTHAYRGHFDVLQNRLRTARPGDSATTKKYEDLFPGLYWAASGEFSISSHDPGVLSSLELPNDRSYQFYYDVYGELARVVLPTGGAYEYDWNTEGPAEGDLRVLRWVRERRLYAADGALESKTTYERERVPQGGNLNVTVKTYDGNGSLRAKSKHYFHGDPLLDSPGDAGYPRWRDGREYRTEEFNVLGAAAVLARVTDTSWTQTPPAWYTLPDTDSAPPNNPRVSEVKTTLVDTNHVARQTFSYDQFNNRTDVWEYDFGAGSPGPLLRRTHTDYVSAPAYTDALTGAHVRNLPGAQWVSPDGLEEHKVSLTTFGYDQFGLADCPNIVGHAPEYSTGYATRGNLTSVTRYANATAGTGAVTSTSTYDIAGNVVGAVDANGNVTQVSYNDSFSDGVARNTYAFPTSVTAGAPNPDPVTGGGVTYAAGTFGSQTDFTSHTVYDFSSGMVTSAIDANAKTTTFSYADAQGSADPLNRLKRVDLPGGGRATYTYVDEHPCGAYVETHRLLDSSGREAKSWQFFDGLGRPYLGEAYENQDPANIFLRVDTRYDWQGRVSQVSSPYRTSGCTAQANPAGQWTTTEYDALGRVRRITTPDGARVQTEYDGLRTLVTDPADRQRMTRVDGLGRLAEVWEIKAADPQNMDPWLASITFPQRQGVPSVSAGYRTSYVYDVLGNLRTVSQPAGAQAGQVRTYVYDSLSRLTSATNPESGTVGYTYDPNGNLLTKTDARGVQTSYAYDRLNRNIITSYSNITPDTPTVLRKYDFAANGKGMPYLTQQIGSTASATYVDEYDDAGRPLVQRQRFQTGGAWGADYRVTRTYDLAGNVLTQTYPSGHAVTYNYDAAGRLGDNGTQTAFSGNLGDGVTRTYAAAVSYSRFGGIQEERFGTQTPLYHKLHYNVRGQLNDVRLSTASWAAGEWDWNRGALLAYYSAAEFSCQEGACRAAGGADNNGNVRRYQHWVPSDDQTSSYSYTEQRYSYDALNRLTSAAEYAGSPAGLAPQPLVQSYLYDRWGNRTVDASQTVGAPATQLDAGDLPNTNRLYAPGDLSLQPQQRRMQYDAAGNLTYDGYTGGRVRSYDGENRMTSAQYSDGQTRTATYTYDGDGRRVKRNSGVGVEVWHVYGMGGELLAEYQPGATSFLPLKEYGSRGGQLLVTMSSGDPDRLDRFIYYMFYGAIQRGPTPQELAANRNVLADAGAQGQAQLLIKAKELARALFASTTYETATSRSDAQYVTDLYYAYLQRAPDTGGLGWWTPQAAGGVQSRINVLNAFEASSEFNALVSTLYGTSVSDDQRTDRYVHAFYLAAYGRHATATELLQQRARLNAKAAEGQSAVQAEAELMGRELFASQVTDQSIADEQYVTNLYEGFLQRGPDASGLSFWTGVAASSRQNVLNAFAVDGGSRALAGTLYREAFWLTTDHLGTPRMVADRTGSLKGIRRHDYLPFGEELGANTGGRTPAQGYGLADNVRQHFTGHEHDDETGLDYAQARYYSSSLGRFLSFDQGKYTPVDPQNWNRYTYVQNNPLKFVDPTGKTLVINGEYADELVGELEAKTGYKLIRDARTGIVTIDRSVNRDRKGTSRHLAGLVKDIIADPGRLTLRTVLVPENETHAFYDNGRATKEIFMDDVRAVSAKDGRLSATLLAHVLKEGLGFVQKDQNGTFLAGEPHTLALEFESKVMSDLTGVKEQTRVDYVINRGGSEWQVMEYTSVTYDVYHKSLGNNPIISRPIVLVHEKKCGCKK